MGESTHVSPFSFVKTIPHRRLICSDVTRLGKFMLWPRFSNSFRSSYSVNCTPAVSLRYTPFNWSQAIFLVPVQFMKIGITLRLAIADHLQAVKTGRFHPAKRLYARRRGTPRRCVFVASASPPLSSCSRHSASPLHSGFHSCLCATLILDSRVVACE